MINTKMYFFGGGTITNSILSRLIHNDIEPSLITVLDRNHEKLKFLHSQYKVNVANSLPKSLVGNETFLLCVKPQSMTKLLTDLKKSIIHEVMPLIISVAAGFTIENIISCLGRKTAVIRAMPNTASALGCGATALYANNNTTAQGRKKAQEIMENLGIITWLEKETMIDIVTAVSGSGPAYFFYMIEALVECAKKAGLPEKQAALLVTQTAFGASKMAHYTNGKDVFMLRQDVTSKEGVTDKSISVLKKYQFEKIINEAVKANIAHSKKLTSNDN
jgi:pyrroline-5-carboxylate reductase